MVNSLTTDFEKSGIAAGRDLAVHGEDEKWRTLPPKGSTSRPNGIQCMADNINFAVQQQLAQETRNGSLKKNGFVNRAVPDHSDETFFNQVVEMAYETSGLGGQHTQMAQFFGKFDRFKRSFVPPNAVFSGHTFFTRPRLCLQDWNIIADRKFNALLTDDPTSMTYAIRCYLDTEFAKTADSSRCPMFDKCNPFFVPLTNSLKSMSGFNDPALVTETTEGGFFSEDQTCVIGGDRLARTYDINTLFKDVPGSLILSTMDYWCQYMANLTDGSMQQYADAIDANRMDYTVSMYRFLMDRTDRYIVRWAKCTGCFPVSPPSGVTFNLNEGEFMVGAAQNLNVPWKVNRIEYDDPVILREFNMLVRRYAKYGNSPFTGKIQAFAQSPVNNFSGVPYIRPSANGYELVWLQRDTAGEQVVNAAERSLSGVVDVDPPAGTKIPVI